MTGARGTKRQSLLRSGRVASLTSSGSSLHRRGQEVVYGAKAIALEQQRAQELYRANIAGLSGKSLQVLADIQGTDAPMEDVTTFDDAEAPIVQLTGPADEPDSLDDQTHEAFIHAVRDMAGERWKDRSYKDARTWRQHIQRMDKNCVWHGYCQPTWVVSMGIHGYGYGSATLVDAYLTWRHPASGPAADEAQDDMAYKFDIAVLDIYSLSPTITIARAVDASSTAQSLVLSGYLGTTPINPLLAISLNTLELL
ncbi:hypothetical protein BKA93DRAFT_747237 [Sparassis latifolia]